MLVKNPSGHYPLVPPKQEGGQNLLHHFAMAEITPSIKNFTCENLQLACRQQRIVFP